MKDGKPFERIITLTGERDKLTREINNLKPSAVQDLRKMGYSADRICKMLGMGKATVLAIINGKKKKVLR